MGELISLSVLALVALLIIGIIFSRLYHRSSKQMSFVRTGLGGQKVVMDGGAIMLPIFHEWVSVNMKTLKLEVSRSGADSLITLDRLRVDAVAAFFVRVMPTVEGIANAALQLSCWELQLFRRKNISKGHTSKSSDRVTWSHKNILLY